MQVFLLLVGIALVMFLIMRGVPIFFTAIIASMFLLITAGQDVIAGMTGTYAGGLSGYFGKQFFLFILGAIFGNMYGETGAADSIANAIINKLGEKAIVPSVLVVGFLLSLGGVSVFVCFFAMYPLMVSMFRKADMSRTLIPCLYFAGAGTATGFLPGSPALQNTVACDELGVAYSCAAAPGWIAGMIEMVLVFIFTIWWVKHTKKKGMHFEEIEDDKNAELKDRPLPNIWLALVPMVILLVVLNFTKIGAAASLFIGVIATLVCFIKFYDIKKVFQLLTRGLNGGINSLFNTSAITGFGTVVASLPAFQSVIDGLQKIGGNPLISSVLAVAVLAGVSGSGTGGEGIALPIIKQYIAPPGSVNYEALARCTALACLTLDSLPQNGLVTSVMVYTKNSHKQAYFPVFINTVIIPIITMVILIALLAAFGYM